VGLIAGIIWRWVFDHLVEPILRLLEHGLVEHLVKMGLGWLLNYVLNLQIWVWIVLALAVILIVVVILIAWHFWRLLFPQGQWPQTIFWLVVFLVIGSLALP
jgi:chromate transport protein ChrA